MHRILSARVLSYLFLLLIVDFCLVSVIRIGEARPIFLYMMIPYTALQWHRQSTLGVALTVGLLRDSVNTSLFGLETVSLLMAAALFDLVAQKVDREAVLIRCGLTFAFVFVHAIIFLILSTFLGFHIPWTWYTLGVSFSSACYTAALAPLFFFLSARWFHDRAAFKQYELFK